MVLHSGGPPPTAAQAMLGPVREAEGLLPGSDDRPADLLLPHWHQGRDAALDFTIVNPLQVALVARVAQEGCRGVAHAHKAKIRKYWARCEAEGIAFFPLAVDTYGGWHEAGLKTLTKLGRQLARATGRDEGDTVRHLRQRVAVLLVRDNMAMLASRTPTFPPASVNGEI